MKHLLLPIIFLYAMATVAIAQKHYTKNGYISFFSTTSLEDIKADNNQVMSVLDIQTGELQFSVLIKSFHFKKALMEEHFNENYMESSKYPKATFKGTVADISKVNFLLDGNYPVSVSGNLTIHGISRQVFTSAKFVIKDGKITGNAVFTIALADYKITVPKLVENNIAKNIEVTVNCLYNQKM